MADYYDSAADRTFFVSQSLGAGRPNAPWYVMYREQGKTATHRYKSIHECLSEKEALSCLEVQAKRKGWRPVQEADPITPFHDYGNEFIEEEPVQEVYSCQPDPDAMDCDISPGNEKCTDCSYWKPVQEAHCRVCGCTEDHACEGGCYWVEPGLCSACVTFTCGRPESFGKYPNCPEQPDGMACIVGQRCGFIKWESKTWPESCEVCRPLDGESDIICGPECPQFRVDLAAELKPVQEVTGQSTGELAHESQMEALADHDTGLTRRFGCTSTPYRTYGDSICPENPDGTGHCKGCYAWKPVEAVPVQEAITPGSGYEFADIDEIFLNPNNPRKHFDQESLDKLVESVKQVGILQPILVNRHADGRLYIVAGERRYRAAQAAGLQLVPVIVLELTEAEEFEVMLTENLQRQDLDPIEEAQAFAAATARGWKQEALAEKLGISQAQVANRLRLLKLPTEVQELISREILSAGHGLALVKVAAAPGMVRDMAKEFTERHIPVKDAMGRINSEISSSAHSYGKNYGRPLYTDGRRNDAPEFDFNMVCLGPYESRKGPCKYIVNAERPCYETKGDESQEGTYCIHPECWDKRQKEAIDTEREAEMAKIRAKAEAAGKDPDKIKLPDLRKLDYNSREVFRSYSEIKIEECPGCEKIIDALDDEEIVRVCTDKLCWDKKVRAKENAKVKETKEKKKEFETVKSAAIAEAMKFDVGRDNLIYIAAWALRTPATSTTWTGYKVLVAACKMFNLDADNERKRTERLKELTTPELHQLIFFCALRGLDEYGRSAFDLTLGAAAGEDAAEA